LELTRSRAAPAELEVTHCRCGAGVVEKTRESSVSHTQEEPLPLLRGALRVLNEVRGRIIDILLPRVSLTARHRFSMEALGPRSTFRYFRCQNLVIAKRAEYSQNAASPPRCIC
jgi:hypothetical protein